MKTLLLMSIFFAQLVIPLAVSRDPNPRRAVRRMLLWLLAFNSVYLAYVTLLHPVLFVPHWP